jgi:uncharacterized protein GlcG (DUF336 family)
MYGKQGLALADARQVAAAAELEAVQHGWHVTIAVLDDTGSLMFLQRMEQAPPGSVTVAQRKAQSAYLFRRPSKDYSDMVAAGRTAIMALPGSLPIEGGLPLLWAAQVIGAIGVSGVTSAQDAQIARAGVAALARLAPGATP